jgi:RNA polymerase sigma-70 factor, ECF subfamily
MPVGSRHEQFLRLFLQHQLQIEAYVRSLVPNRADADELLQDVAAVLWRKFDDFQLGTRFDHWACRVAHNNVLNYFRHKRREAHFFSEYTLAALSEAVIRQNDVWTQRHEALATCLQLLPQADRELIHARFQPATTNRSLAQQSGRSESAISRALNRIYLALLNCIQQRVDVSAERGAS